MKLTEDSKNAIIVSESHIVARRLSLSAQLSLQDWYCQKYCLVANQAGEKQTLKVIAKLL